MKKLFDIVFGHNWFAIFYFNFKMLPFYQAIKLPFDFNGSIRFGDLSGKVILTSATIGRAMVRVGGGDSDFLGKAETVVKISGTFEVGNKVSLGAGSSLYIREGAIVKMSDDIIIGARTRIYCVDRIDIGNETRFSWECQVFDTNFHYTEDISSHTLSVLHSPITIGAHSWIGNRVSIMKGTVLPDYSIIASNSMANKDYSANGSYCLYGGSPVKIIKQGVRRIFQKEIKERNLHE